MYKYFILIIAYILGFNATSNAQTSITLRAGGGLQNINGKDANGSTSKNNVIPAYHFGILMNFGLVDDFSIQTGAIFATKGTKIKDDYLGTPRTRTIHLNYIELPVSFFYKPIIGKNKLLLGFGPYVGFGLSGKIKSNLQEDEKIIWQNSVGTNQTGHNYFRRIESGANFLFGMEFFEHLQLQLNAQLGLTKINPTDARIADDKTIMKNTGFGISLGWKL